MGNWVRRIRGAIGIGLAWAAAWFSVGMILLFIVGFGAADVPFPLFFGLLGFLAGVIFSMILGMAESRRTFEQMSLSRFAAWGAIGGALLAGGLVIVSGLSGGFVYLGPLFALFGAASAAGSLALARRAERRSRLPGEPADRPQLP